MVGCVPARGEAELDVAITVPAATAGNSDDFRDIAGLIAFTPTAGGNRGIALRVPYYGVPPVSSNVASALSAAKPRTSDAIHCTGGIATDTVEISPPASGALSDTVVASPRGGKTAK